MASKEMRKKRVLDSKEMPTDFWNYLVNPIVGYYVEPVLKTKS